MMIDIPIGKALAAVEEKNWDGCTGCIFLKGKGCLYDMCGKLACDETNREDGKDVIFRLVDLPENDRPLCPICPERADCPHADNRTKCWEYDKSVGAKNKESSSRLAAILDKIDRLGVLGIEVDGAVHAQLCALESVLDIIERHKDKLDCNAGEIEEGLKCLV